VKVTRDVTLRGVYKCGELHWRYWPDDYSLSQSNSALEAVESAAEVNP